MTESGVRLYTGHRELLREKAYPSVCDNWCIRLTCHVAWTTTLLSSYTLYSFDTDVGAEKMLCVGSSQNMPVLIRAFTEEHLQKA